MVLKNTGCEFDKSFIKNVRINLSAIKNKAQALQQSRTLKNEHEIAWLLKAITCIDLTTLCGDDTYSNISRLCQKAAKPLPENILKEFAFDSSETIQTAAVCVYPSRIKDVVNAFQQIQPERKINIASVAAGFPSGQMPLESRLTEIKIAVEDGATEIDIVIDRNLVLTGEWKRLYDEIKEMKSACGDAHLKTILAAGELANLSNVYKASMVAMMAGSDFIKTSTGKETLNATIPFGIVMCRAINEYFEKTGYQVGLKPAGGIRTCNDALLWLILVKEELGNDWLSPDLFRIGASGLLADIEKQIYFYVTGRFPASYELDII